MIDSVGGDPPKSLTALTSPSIDPHVSSEVIVIWLQVIPGLEQNKSVVPKEVDAIKLGV